MISNIQSKNDSLFFQVDFVTQDDYFYGYWSDNLFLMINYGTKTKVARIPYSSSEIFRFPEKFSIPQKFTKDFSIKVIGDIFSMGQSFTHGGDSYLFDPLGKVESDWYEVKYEFELSDE